MAAATVTATATAVPTWVACPQCRTPAFAPHLSRNLGVCGDCGHHHALAAGQRLAALLDPGSLRPIRPPATVEDPLEFADTRPYRERLRDARARTGLDDAVACATGTLHGHRVTLAVLDFGFMGGSLGCAMGETLCHCAALARAQRTPLVLVCASGGARMQEGALALMQLAKTSAALAELDEAGILTVSVITDPTYGGVAASFATLPDVVIAEPGARMGFAGPRVIKQTIGQELPEGFQTSEFLLKHGLIDGVVERRALRGTLGRILAAAEPAAEPGAADDDDVADDDDDDDGLTRDPADLPERDAWQAVLGARKAGRPTTLDYIREFAGGFEELHGDRRGGDCPAIVGGLGMIAGRPAVIVGHQKGSTAQENVARNFGMPTPDGYRKAARLFGLAAKLSLPVVTLIDTPGAYPGAEAEACGQAFAIAENLRLMSGLPVPIVSVIIGEGGSGGALALGVADRVIALSNAVYSVISPEGCAAILWRNAARAPTAANALQVDARQLLRLGVVDAVLTEPDGGAQAAPQATARRLGRAISHTLRDLARLDPALLVAARRDRFRRFGTLPVTPS